MKTCDASKYFVTRGSYNLNATGKRKRETGMGQKSGEKSFVGTGCKIPIRIVTYAEGKKMD